MSRAMITNVTFSIFPLLLLPSLVPNPGFSIHESGLNALNSNTTDTPDISISSTLSDPEQRKQQGQANGTLMQGQENWSTYEDPLIGIQFERPSWWKETQEEDLVKFYILTNPDDLLYYELFANVHYFLPPLPEEMNTLDKFMRQIMNELRSDSTKNISINRTSTIGADDIPAYRVEYDNILGYNNALGKDLNFKNVRYFAIDNSTRTGYMISLVTNMDRLQEDVPLFERLVESFKTLV